MLKIVLVIGLTFLSALASADQKSFRCHSYGDAENGVELEVTQRVGGEISATFFQRLLGRLIPTPIGSLRLNADTSRGIELYTLAPPSDSLSFFELKIWHRDIRTMTVTFPRTKSWSGAYAKAQIQFKGRDVVEADFVCVNAR